LLALRTGNLLNIADLARTCGIASNTLKRYVHLLECLFLIILQPSWRSDHEKRFTKAPKVYLLDTSFLNYLLNFNFHRFETMPDLIGSVLESFVVSELHKQSQWSLLNIRHFHFRLDEIFEVDIVLENAEGLVVGIEVKSSSTVHPDDFKGLKKLQEIAKTNFVRGILLYMGTETYAIGHNLWAVPLSALWEV
jgi:predicted AAA+ superfamily ATPase